MSGNRTDTSTDKAAIADQNRPGRVVTRHSQAVDIVAQEMNRDPTICQRRTCLGSYHLVFFEKVLHSMDCQPLSPEAREEHIMIAPLGFAQPGFEHRTGGFRQRRTPSFAPLADYLQVGSGSHEQIFSFESGHLRYPQTGLHGSQNEGVITPS